MRWDDERGSELMRSLAGNLGKLDPRLMNTPDLADEARVRGDDGARIAMRLHDAGIRIDVEEGGQLPQVDRVLEQPAPARIGRFDQLEDAPVA